MASAYNITVKSPSKSPGFIVHTFSLPFKKHLTCVVKGLCFGRGRFSHHLRLSLEVGPRCSHQQMAPKILMWSCSPIYKSWKTPCLRAIVTLDTAAPWRWKLGPKSISSANITYLLAMTSQEMVVTPCAVSPFPGGWAPLSSTSPPRPSLLKNRW